MNRIKELRQTKFLVTNVYMIFLEGKTKQMDYKIIKHIRKKYKLMIRLLKNLFKKNKKLNLKMNEKE